MADVKIVIDSSDVKRANADTKALKSTYTALDKQMKPLIAKEQAFAKTVRAVNDAMRLGLKTNKEAIADIQKLGKAYGYTDTQINRVTASMSGVRKNTNRMNAVVQNAGYQFGDFAVQVQSGQNVLVAFSQQGAQLAGLLPGVTGAIAGVALVIGSSLARALMETTGLFQTFSDKVKGLKEAVDSLQTSASDFSAALRDDLAPEIKAFNETLFGRDLKRAAEEAGDVLDKLQDKIKKQLKDTIQLRNAQAAILDRRFVISREKKLAEFLETEEALRNLEQVAAALEEIDTGFDPEKPQRYLDAISLIERVINEEFAPGLDLSKNLMNDLVEAGRALREAQKSVAETQEVIGDSQEEQVESTGRILDYNKELLSVERERASLAESIEQTFERTARQAKLMQEGMDRGVAGQVASMEMRIAKERELLIQLENAGHVDPGTALSTSVTRGQQLEQYTANLTEMAAKKAVSATEQLTDAQKALQDYGDKLEQIRLQVSGEFAGTMIDAFREVADGTKTVGQAFGDMAEQIIRQILDLLIYQPLLRSLTNALVPGMGSGVFGAATQALAGSKPLPGVPAGGSVRGSYKFAKGGIVNSPTMFGMSGGRTGLMGEAGPEAILPLKRGAGGKLGVEGGGNVTVQQNFNFAANGDESVKKIIAEAAPGIAKMTEAQIVNSRQRGGQMRRVFS